ncbi:uncharacterized protein Z518_11046 [Rhinocladiella mackenziei CBS 650.93]|uniref:Uncharacterized protein n=1 Tax=Rhinocladiella mackenziei CBS 650.93 TaxID=1442369 RepID=A0A0D2I1L5_9EURO|nr:uncharacterized protein Z518_11046 [Rhinocladiella mackenziei CBS 650.93]KIW99633.1 hypothetical protein Z518_11046 [Rhinocladiella mackenziei CBS 650.93]
MTTFIAYQPRESAPLFGSHTFGNSPTVGLPSWVSSRQSPKSPQQATPVSNADFVDLTVSGQNTARKRLVASGNQHAAKSEKCVLALSAT